MNKKSYRITVRQLESMVRLSEAMARVHLDDEVKPEYVLEAYRLLRKSIIHVESNDVELGEMADIMVQAGVGVEKPIFQKDDGTSGDETDRVGGEPPGAGAEAEQGAGGTGDGMDADEDDGAWDAEEEAEGPDADAASSPAKKAPAAKQAVTYAKSVAWGFARARLR